MDESWTREARINRGELCQRCGGFNWPQDREGQQPQLCLRCRYADLQDELAAAGRLPEPCHEKTVRPENAEPPRFAEVHLSKAIQHVIDNGILDPRSKQHLTEAVAVAGLSDFLRLSPLAPNP